jgi:hypothetical protein
MQLRNETNSGLDPFHNPGGKSPLLDRTSTASSLADEIERVQTNGLASTSKSSQESVPPRRMAPPIEIGIRPQVNQDHSVVREDVVPASSSPGDEDMASNERYSGGSSRLVTEQTQGSLQFTAAVSSTGDASHRGQRGPAAGMTPLNAKATDDAPDHDAVAKGAPFASLASRGRLHQPANLKSSSVAEIAERYENNSSIGRLRLGQYRSLDLDESRHGDYLQATQTSSKDSESFLESRDRKLLRHSEQGLQLTDLLGGIRANRAEANTANGPSRHFSHLRGAQGDRAPDPSATSQTDAGNNSSRTVSADRSEKPEVTRQGRARQQSTNSRDSDAVRRSRLNTLPDYRRLGRTRDPGETETPATAAVVEKASLLEEASPGPSTGGMASGDLDEGPVVQAEEPRSVRTGIPLKADEPKEHHSPRSRRLSEKARAIKARDPDSDSSSEPEAEDDETYRPAQAFVRKRERVVRSGTPTDGGSADELALGAGEPLKPSKQTKVREENKARPAKKRKLDTKAVEGQTKPHSETKYSRVFARWSSDRAYYPGSVKGVSGKRLTIFFDDETTDEVEWHQIRKCEIKSGDTVVDLSSRPFKDVTVNASAPGPLKTGDKITVQRSNTVYELLLSQIRIREKWIGQMDDRKVQVNDITVDSVWTDPRTRLPAQTPEQQHSRATTPIAKSTKQGSVASSPARSNKTHTGIFDGLGFLITSPSQNEEIRKRKVAKRITANGGMCANEIWDFYEKQPMDNLAEGYAAIGLKDSTAVAKLRGVFLVVIGQPTLTPKYLMALALGVPCLSANYIDEAITSVSEIGRSITCRTY